MLIVFKLHEVARSLGFFSTQTIEGVGGEGSFLSLYSQVHLAYSADLPSTVLIQTTKRAEDFILPSSLLGAQGNKT